MKKKITQQDYLKANRKAAREEEIQAHGHPVGHRRIHKSDKIYDRKKEKAGLKDLPDFLSPARTGESLLSGKFVIFAGVNPRTVAVK